MIGRKIYFVVGSFKLGGTERTASRIGLELLNRGYNVKFLLINGIFEYDDPKLLKNSVVLSNPGSSKLLKILNVLFKLNRIVRKEKPDYLVSFSLGINLLIFFVFYPKTIFRMESNIFRYKTKLYRRYLQNYFSMSPHVKKVIIPSGGLYKRSLEYFKKKEKLVQIDNPIDINDIDIKKKCSIHDFPQLEIGKFIVSAGRLHYDKGFEQLIRIYGKTLYQYDYKLLLLGEGPERPKLERTIKELNLGDNVVLAGYQNNPYRFFSKSRFFVLNSEHESFSNVIIEAFACGVPVISNDCDFGPRHIIKHNQNGILFNNQKPYEVEDALIKLVKDEKFYQRLKAGAENSKQRYDVCNVVNDWIKKVFP